MATVDDWAHEVGVTTSSFGNQITADAATSEFSVFDLPRIMRDELDMRIIDLNTNTLGSLEAAHVDRFRNEVDKAGCIVTNLKLNQFDVDMSSPDPETRAHALDIYRRSVDVAVMLGARWVRPHPKQDRPDMDLHIAGYRALVEYANTRNIQVIVENYGWMSNDIDSTPDLIKAVDRDLHTSPDTGSWADNAVRYPGLERIFPLAVTCDYKAFVLGPDQTHEDYDLRRCFTIGRDAGFRGPWCIEHWNSDWSALRRELRFLRDCIGEWSQMD
ncbi:MAG: sugar phosphate isomerase/epimerase [Gemmatimonadetes bacterium]|jgi:hypothetical protein|nr:sugar phosphate isomerase/epimerase [Gemmatimonadota bacterium]